VYECGRVCVCLRLSLPVSVYARINTCECVHTCIYVPICMCACLIYIYDSCAYDMFIHACTKRSRHVISRGVAQLPQALYENSTSSAISRRSPLITVPSATPQEMVAPRLSASSTDASTRVVVSWDALTTGAQTGSPRHSYVRIDYQSYNMFFITKIRK
jgi:hypothetical protein